VAPAEMQKTLFYECYESLLLNWAGNSRTSEVFGTVSEDDEPRDFEAEAS